MGLVGMLNKAAKPFGLKVARNKPETPGLYYQHDYGNGGYEAYRSAQVAANKRKLDKVWADGRTLETIADYIEAAGMTGREGLCHGARNGWEVQWLKQRLGAPVIGTDISETANDMPDMVQHDFHETRADWLSRFAWIYTNSLDQAFDPRKALKAWADQLTDDGLIFIEHTIYHGPRGAGEMDPFGADPMIMPYLIFEWGRGHYELADILKLSDVSKPDGDSKGHVWVFVLRKWPR